MKIITNNIKNPQVMALLQAHHDDMLNYSPIESVHALDVTGLEVPEVTFFSFWIENELAGVGAVKQLDARHGEIKSMRTSANFLRQGIARKLLQHIVELAQERNYHTLSLETGTAAAFKPAQKLYQAFGFQECEPFSDYEEDPYSMFMTKTMPSI